MKKLLACLAIVLVAVSITACGGRDENTVRIGLVGTLHYQWYAIRDMVYESDGITLEFVFFNDFATPNRALADGEIEMNAFQHRMFLNNEMATHGYELSYVGVTFVAPLTLWTYHDHVNSVADLTDGAVVAIPGDPTNVGRSLRLLESAGLIVLDTPPDALATEADIVEFVADITLRPMDNSLIANILPDVAAGIITNPTAFIAGLRHEPDSIFVEDIDVTGPQGYNMTNIIAVRTADLEAGGRLAEMFEIIARAHNSEAVRQVMLDAYQGALVPVW